MSTVSTLAPPIAAAPAEAVAAESVTACAHCGAAVAGPGRFCCSGCAAAYGLVRELGLGRYYDARSLDPARRRPRPPEEITGDIAAFVHSEGDGTQSLDLLVDGLHCAACVWLIESALAQQPETVEARANLTGRRLHLRWRQATSPAGTAADDSAPGARLVDIVQRLGYRVVPCEASGIAAEAGREERDLLRALAVAGFAAANVMLLSVSVWAGEAGEMGTATRDFLHWVSALIALPAIAYAGRPFLHSAVTALRHGRTNMDVPITIGVSLAAAMSLFETVHSGRDAYFDSALTLLFFLLIGRYLDLRARGRARATVEHLIGLTTIPATRLAEDGRTQRVAASAVKPGDTLLVAAGERVPADGRVTVGRSSVDKSLIDGESLPVPVSPGTAVFAGMVNLAAPLRLVVTAVGSGTLIAEIRRLMEAAERGRTRLSLLADRIARRYAPAVHLLALATFLGWLAVGPWQPALLNAVAVLIITCPCALGLAVPVVQVVAAGRLVRGGILLKSATALERLAAVDTVVFDKTGTVTLGRLELKAQADLDAGDLREAAGLAAASRHPLSRALCRACPDATPVEGVVEEPGRGLRHATAAGEIRLGSRDFCGIAAATEDAETATGTDPEMWLARPGRAPVRFTFADALRPDAGAVVAALAAQGRRVILLSGDRRPAVAAIAAALGIAEWRAAMHPAEKCAALAELAAGGAHVMMVGDGLNDAPALAAAEVSMSPASAADLCQTAADVVFQGSSLDAVREVLTVARRSAGLVRHNIALAIGYNLLAVPLAMAGLVTPLIAAAAMSSSSILVVGNALRLGLSRR